MDSFASIFINYQKVGTCNDPEGEYAFFVDDSSLKAFSFFAEKASLLAKLEPWRHPDARGKKRADIDNDKFTIKYAHMPKIFDRLNVAHPRSLQVFGSLGYCWGPWPPRRTYTSTKESGSAFWIS